MTPGRTSSPGPSPSIATSRSWWPPFAIRTPSFRCASASRGTQSIAPVAEISTSASGSACSSEATRCAVHVRLERGDGVDLDDGDAAAGAAGRAGEALPDPAVADDAELAPGEVEVGQPVDRGERRLPGAVAVVEQVLAERVVRRDRREGELAGRLHRAEPRDARRRLLGHARQPGGELRPVLDDPRRQLGAVVDDDLRTRVRDGEQVGVELLARGAVPVRAPRSRARRAPRRSRPGSSRGSSPRRPPARPRPRAASRGRPSSPRGGRRRRPGGRCSAPSESRSRARAVEDGRVLRDPPDPLLALGGERRIGDARAGGGVHPLNLERL